MSAHLFNDRPPADSHSRYDHLREIVARAAQIAKPFDDTATPKYLAGPEDHFAKSSVGFQDSHRSAGRPDPQNAFAQIGFAYPFGNLLARREPTDLAA